MINSFLRRALSLTFSVNRWHLPWSLSLRCVSHALAMISECLFLVLYTISPLLFFGGNCMVQETKGQKNPAWFLDVCSIIMQNFHTIPRERAAWPETCPATVSAFARGGIIRTSEVAEANGKATQFDVSLSTLGGKKLDCSCDNVCCRRN